MEKLSVEDVSKLLSEKKLPDSLIKSFEGYKFLLHVCLSLYLHPLLLHCLLLDLYKRLIYSTLLLDNYIDGPSMLMLLEEFEEFKNLVRLRVKIKDLIQNVRYHHKKIIAIKYIYVCMHVCVYVYI